MMSKDKRIGLAGIMTNARVFAPFLTIPYVERSNRPTVVGAQKTRVLTDGKYTGWCRKGDSNPHERKLTTP